MPKAADDDPVFVAVGEDVEESRPTLLWTLRNLQPVVLHLLLVHQPREIKPSSSGLEQSEINQILRWERDSVYESLLPKYAVICQNEGVNEQNIHASFIPKGDVGKGILKLIPDLRIKKLVVGTAPDNTYRERMVHITSRKAKYLRQHAPLYCNIWFVCNGNLIESGRGQFGDDGSSHSSVTDYSEESWSDRISRQLEPLPEAGKKADEAVEMVREFEMLFNLQLKLREESEVKLQKEREKRKKTKHERDKAISCFRDAEELYKSEQMLRLVVEEILRRKNEETERIKKEAASSSLPQPGSDQPPPYFICPISKEIMRDPVVAADGYTYEAAEIRRWLRTGETSPSPSPMTGLGLENQNLVPNLTLRSAIKEWLQQHPDSVDSS